MRAHVGVRGGGERREQIDAGVVAMAYLKELKVGFETHLLVGQLEDLPHT